MDESAPKLAPRGAALLGWFVVASALTHLMLLLVLPVLRRAPMTLPSPLQVELREPPPEVEPALVAPKPMPMETQPPQPRERPKPAAAKPKPVKVAPHEARPVEPPRASILTAPRVPIRTAPRVPIRTAPRVAEASVEAAVVPAVPEPKPAPPPPRAKPAPVVAPAPVAPPRTDAAYLSNPKPLYPLAARRRGEQGTVWVRVLVSAEGLAARVSLEQSSGHPALDEAALTAVKSWRFVPAQQGGRAVESPYTVPVVFKLD